MQRSLERLAAAGRPAVAREPNQELRSVLGLPQLEDGTIDPRIETVAIGPRVSISAPMPRPAERLRWEAVEARRPRPARAEDNRAEQRGTIILRPSRRRVYLRPVEQWQRGTSRAGLGAGGPRGAQLTPEVGRLWRVACVRKARAPRLCLPAGPKPQRPSMPAAPVPAVASAVLPVPQVPHDMALKPVVCQPLRPQFELRIGMPTFLWPELTEQAKNRAGCSPPESLPVRTAQIEWPGDKARLPLAGPAVAGLPQPAPYVTAPSPHAPAPAAARLGRIGFAAESQPAATPVRRKESA
jgi:hypothetical protein